MNNARRAQIKEAGDLVAKAVALLEEARDDEQAYFDEMPENFQNAERGQAAEEAVSLLDDLIVELENADFDQFGG